MSKYLLGVVSGLVLAVFLAVFLVIVVVFAARPAAPSVADGSVLTLPLSGDLIEHQPIDFSLDSLRRGGPTTLLGLRGTLQHAAEDKRIKGLVIEGGGLRAGWAKAQELRWTIEEFRKQGKPVVAYLRFANSLDYYIASAADEVYLGAEDYLDVKGFRAEVSFFKETLDKLGVAVEMERVGEYKAAVEPYLRSSMSEAYRRNVDALLDEILRQFLDGVSASRGITPEQLRAALDEGPFLPEAAVRSKLVDGIFYMDELEERVKKLLEISGDLEKISAGAYRRATQDRLQFGKQHKKVAVLYGVGAIMRGDGDPDPFSGAAILGADGFSKAVRAIREDDEIEGAILRIDSPGGDAVASDWMWREINLLVEKKPVIVSMSDVAASGGYYIAMAKGAPILAYPGTYTGSIGVFYGKVNLRGLYEKIGVTKDIVTRGRFAAIDSDYTPLDEQGRAKVREGVENVYRTFVEKAAEARGKSFDEIDEAARGRVWLGTQALEAGLIDELGGFGRAIEMIKERVEVDPDDKVRLVFYPARKTLLELLISRDRVTAGPLAPAWVRERIPFVETMPVLAGGGVLALAPFSITIR